MILVKLGEVIQRGWPNDKISLHACVLTYHSYRDELYMQDGVIYRGERVVIPTALMQEIKKVHAEHEKSAMRCQLARNVL